MLLNRESSTPLYRQIYHHYKSQIINQTLPSGTKLPSIRGFSRSHRLSKTTVEKAYHQLLIEGYIQSEPKRGYFVLPLNHKPSINPQVKAKFYQANAYINLSQLEESFDSKPLKKCFIDTFYDDASALYSPPEPQGERVLREQIGRFLHQQRNVICQPTQVLIASGVQNLLLHLATFSPYARIAYLDPLFERARVLFTLLKATLIPCKTMDDLYQSSPDIIYISPSNLYPSGDVLPISERLKLISFAEHTKTIIIEDDYNYIYRYNAYQIPSLFELSRGENVFYIGSFARNLLISIRISYMVIPEGYLERYHQSSKLAQSVSKPEQLAVSKFIERGFYQRHLKKLSAYARKFNERITEYLERLPLRDGISISGTQSNLHILIHCTTPELLDTLRAIANDLNLYVTSFETPTRTLLLPYGGLDETMFKRCVDTLIKA